MSKKERIKYLFYYSDIETYDPSNTVEFWVAGVQSEHDGYKVFHDFDDYFEYLTAPAPKGHRKVFIFHNVKYDLGVIQKHAMVRYGYKRNPKEKGQLKSFYNAQHTELYVDNPRNPIIFVDSIPIMPGKLAKWGELAGMEKGDYTYFPKRWEEPSEELLKYLKRDVEIVAYWYPKLKGEEAFTKGLLTISSVVKASIDDNVRSIKGQREINRSFKISYAANKEKKQETTLPIPTAVKNEIEASVRAFIEGETKISSKDGKRLYGLNKNVIDEYRTKCYRYWMGELNQADESFKARQKYVQSLLTKKDKHEKLTEEEQEEVADFFRILPPPDAVSPDWKEHVKPYHMKKLTNLMNRCIQSSMRGGISYVNPLFKDKLLEKGGVIDVNSLYPYIILAFEIPNVYVGSSQDYVNPTKYYVAEIKRLKAKCKKGCHPFLKRSTKFTNDKTYHRKIDWAGRVRNGTWDTVLTSVEIEYMKMTYDIEILEYGTVYYFTTDDKWLQGVRRHILHWKKIKEETPKDSPEHQFAKMMLNTVWGRWGMYEKIVENGGSMKDVGDKETNLVSASFTTALSRIYLNKMINFFGADFIYCDTDSVHFLFRKYKDEKALRKALGEKIDKTLFGAWDLEKVWDEGRYLKNKTYAYVESKTKKLKVTTAGSAIKIKSLSEFYSGAEFPKLEHKTDKETGLIKLTETTFTL